MRKTRYIAQQTSTASSARCFLNNVSEARFHGQKWRSTWPATRFVPTDVTATSTNEFISSHADVERVTSSSISSSVRERFAAGGKTEVAIDPPILGLASPILAD